MADGRVSGVRFEKKPFWIGLENRQKEGEKRDFGQPESFAPGRCAATKLAAFLFFWNDRRTAPKKQVETLLDVFVFP